MVHGWSLGNFNTAIADKDRNLFHHTVYCQWCFKWPKLNRLIVFVGSNKLQVYTSWTAMNFFSKSEVAENFFFYIFMHKAVWLQTKDAITLACSLLLRDTRLSSWRRKKKHTQHSLKLLMFYPIIHRLRTWEYVFVRKPWLDMVEPASLVPVSHGWHVWKLLLQSISKVQVLKYLSRQSFILAVDCLSTLPAP